VQLFPTENDQKIQTLLHNIKVLQTLNKELMLAKEEQANTINAQKKIIEDWMKVKKEKMVESQKT
jgi:hypothetical protein